MTRDGPTPTGSIARHAPEWPSAYLHVECSVCGTPVRATWSLDEMTVLED